MKQYINKDALVAEITKLKGKVDDGSSYCNGWQHALRMLEIELNILEVKEVSLEDLKEELDRVVKIYKPDGDFGWGTLYNIAKHFFELGLKAQKGE
jgi:hypothetical protein